MTFHNIYLVFTAPLNLVGSRPVENQLNYKINSRIIHIVQDVSLEQTNIQNAILYSATENMLFTKFFCLYGSSNMTFLKTELILASSVLCNREMVFFIKFASPFDLR